MFQIVIFIRSAIFQILLVGGVIKQESVLKKWIDDLCPALIMTTIRICAMQVSAYGDTYNAIRAWHVVQTLAAMYKRKYLQLVGKFAIDRFASFELFIPDEGSYHFIGRCEAFCEVCIAGDGKLVLLIAPQ